MLSEKFAMKPGTGRRLLESERGLRLRRKGLAFLFSAFRFILIAGICFTILFPLLFSLITSIKTASDIYNPTSVWFPRNTHFRDIINNYRDAITVTWYWESLLNTVIYTLITVVTQIAASCFIGYGLARFKFPGCNLLFALVVFTIIVPPFTTLVPTYLNFQNFDVFGILKLTGLGPVNLNDNYIQFVLTCITGFGFRGGLHIFIMRQFFKGVPRELSEAAGIDGCGMMRTFFQVMLPSATGAIITVTIFAIVWQWTDNINTSIFMSSGRFLMKSLQGAASQYGTIMAGSGAMMFPTSRSASEVSLIVQATVVLVIIPMIILYLALQRYFVESIEATGLVE